MAEENKIVFDKEKFSRKASNFVSNNFDDGKIFLKCIKRVGYKDLQDYVDTYILQGFATSVAQGIKQAETGDYDINNPDIDIASNPDYQRMRKIVSNAEKLPKKLHTVTLKIEDGIFKIFFLELIVGFPQKAQEEARIFFANLLMQQYLIQGQSERGKELIEFIKTVPIINIKGVSQKLDYWKYEPNKLQELYTGLLDNKMLENNPDFFQNFSSISNIPQNKTVWLKGQTQIVYLFYLIYNGVDLNNESIYHIICKLFKQPANIEFQEKNLATTYSNIRERIESKSLPNTLKKIQKIFNDLQLK